MLKINTLKIQDDLGEEKSLGQRVDDLGKLEERIEALERKLAKNPAAKLLVSLVQKAGSERAALQDAMEVGLDAYENSAVSGDEYAAGLGPRAKKRTVIHPEKVFEFLSAEDLVALVTFKLGDLDKYLTPKQLDQILQVDHVGPRRLKLEKL